MLVEGFLLAGLLSLGVSALPAVQQRSSAGYISMPFIQHTRATPAGLTKRAFSADLVNQIYYYTMDISLGTPPQPLRLVLDTGSSDIWAYSPQSVNSCASCTTEFYDNTKSSTASLLPEFGVFNISYGTPNSGVTGYYAADTLTVGEISVTQTVGVGVVANEGDPPGGIFGIGLSLGESLVSYTGQSYPGYIDTLYSQGKITGRGYSIFLNAQTPTSTDPGTIIFGGYDSSKWTGDLVAFPIDVPAPDGVYRLVVNEPALTINLNGQSAAIAEVSDEYTVLLDTGTAVTRIPVAQFAIIGAAVGAQLIDDGPIYAVDCTLASATGGIDFKYEGPNGDVTIAVPWRELVLPGTGLPAGYCAFGLAPLPAAGARGVYIFGPTVLRSMYLLYNFDTLTIGIAQANYGTSTGPSKAKSL